METETKVSIIVPVYNAEQYLDKCLESLTNQTLQDIEIICVDNCSTDHSRDIIQQWGAVDQRIKVILNDENIGQGGSMIKGLSNASGEYIAECDADDWVELCAYERLYNAAKAVDADVVRCNAYKHYGGIQEAYRNGGDGIYNVCFNPQSLDHRTLMCVIGRWCCIPAGIYRRAFIQDNNLWYRPDTQFEDNSLSFKIRTTAKRYMYIADFLYHYRMDNLTSGTATITSVDGIFEQFAEIHRYSKGKGLDDLINTWKYYIYLWAYNRLTTADSKKKFLQDWSEDIKNDNVCSDLLNSDQDYKIWQSIKECRPSLG